MEDKFIDIERIIASKSEKWAKRLPKFIIRYLKKTLHQEEINQLLKENENIYGYDFCRDIIKRWDITLKVNGLENVPKTGGAIFAANHPLGGMDAIAIVDALADYRSDIKFLVNDLLMNLKNLKGLFIGVNKFGGNSLSSLQEVQELFASEQAIFVFPAGMVSRKIDGMVQDLEWKKTFITRAKKNNKDVIPVYIDGKLSNFFYRLAAIRSALKIKLNIDMLYLADELYKQHGKTINITFGKPIPASTFDQSKNDQEWAAWVRAKTYELR